MQAVAASEVAGVVPRAIIYSTATAAAAAARHNISSQYNNSKSFLMESLSKTVKNRRACIYLCIIILCKPSSAPMLHAREYGTAIRVGIRAPRPLYTCVYT